MLSHWRIIVLDLSRGSAVEQLSSGYSSLDSNHPIVSQQPVIVVAGSHDVSH